MKTYKLLVNFNENTRDYASATIYTFMDEKIAALPEIRKPDDITEYTPNWKNGLYVYYEGVAQTILKDENATFIHL